MLSLKLKANQKRVDILSDWAWSFLNTSFVRLQRPRPKLFLFLSEESKGSLSKRTPEERDFIHQIQNSRGAAVLHQKPFIGYVSHLNQVVEETAHLYSLSCQKQAMPTELSQADEINIGILHESFGNMVQQLLMPTTTNLNKKTKDPVWDRIHREGFRTGSLLANALFDQKISRPDIVRWLKLPWHQKGKTTQALQFSRRLLESLS